MFSSRGLNVPSSRFLSFNNSKRKTQNTHTHTQLASMMKSAPRAAFLLTCILSSVVAFSPNLSVSSTHKTLLTSPTALGYTVVGPPPDEDDPEAEESFFARKRREKAEEEANLREKYVESGLNLSEIDMMETPDMYDNPTGGGIIPGVHLSALMEDD
mmetsp:Transcript_37312/g.75984  ORF Transcript_37312/g.75984 Transcript_37312/m.75984 type:complete len:157 (-) Transcript_37312:231-701(-)